MGYYVTLVSSTAKLEKKNQAKAYKRMCDLNTTHDSVKRGGSFGGGKQTEKWFSWMDADYPSKCKDAESILQMLGFETESDDEALFITAYDSKTGQEELFIEAIGDLLSGEMEWRGEEGEMWKWSFGPKGMTTRAGKVVYED